MRRILFSLSSISIALLCAGGCGEVRTNQYTFTKTNVTQIQVMEDANRLKDTTGVDKALPNVDALGNGTLQVYLDENKEIRGMLRVMNEMGYHLVTP